MNTENINLTSSADIPDGAMVRPWMLQSGPELHGYIKMTLVGGLPVEAAQAPLTGAEAAKLRDALNLHLTNIGYLDAPVSAEEIDAWQEDAILEVADRLTRATINGQDVYVDQHTGERFTLQAAKAIEVRAAWIRDTYDLQTVLANRGAKATKVINLSGQAGISAEAAWTLVLTPAGNGPGHGSWDQHGTFYTAAAVRSLKVKAERHAAFMAQFPAAK